MRRSALVAVAAAAIAGFGGMGMADAMSPRPGDTASGASDRYRCFDSENIRNFDFKDSRHLIIVSDFGQAYELELGGACIGLDTAFRIGVKTRMGSSQVCGAFDADIVYSDPMSLREVDTCPVTGVRHLTGDEAAAYVPARSKRQE